MFGYAVKGNEGNPERVRSRLLCIVDHAFDDHSSCSEEWCEFFKDRENYKHKSLPYGKDLVGEDLRRSLKNVFERYAYHAEKLAPSGSTQSNESFNQMIAAKAPESLSFRFGAAVCIKNEGQKYVADVFQKLKIPVSTATRVYAARLIRKAKLRKDGDSSKEFKRRRNQLRERKERHEFSLAVREGPSYKPGIVLEDSEESIMTKFLILYGSR